MAHLCRECAREAVEGEAYCVRHLGPVALDSDVSVKSWKPQLFWAALISTLVLAAVALLVKMPTATGEPRVMMTTLGPTATVVVEPTATNTPLPTITPTPLPTETPLPSNKPTLVNMTSDVMYVTSALVDAEARGMGRTAMIVVACNVLREHWEVGGDWHKLTARWSPLSRILGGESFPQPSETAQAVVRDAHGTEVCRDYPSCSFLGTLYDLSAWRSLGYIDEGSVDARVYTGPGGTQMLVCIVGVPDLPMAPGK